MQGPHLNALDRTWVIGNKLFCDGVLDQIPIPMHLGQGIARPS